ncbi:hypothetical protein PMAYCL1PPCAC_31153 [Pristionchus mayeri]|uniref:Fas-binding factor 1 C-terminal domain-containing protein n=1 Tax=Pristionchus mayeri TaxID=1317129 RepID=A0AAN5ICC9_9BILA|nr:hypothetical protein PMAYCL1PPCAC_31153 [Pristionchus mayeri]
MQNWDDLDNAILGRKGGGSAAAAKPSTSKTSALDSLFSEPSAPSRRPTTSAPKKPSVSFLDEITGDAPSKTSSDKRTIDDLFNEAVPSRPTTSSGGGGLFGPSSSSAGGSSGGLFGNPRPSSIGGATRGRREQRTETPQVTPEVAVPTPTVEISDGSGARAARLQEEIERLNREIVDIRRQKKEDEDVLIREWKEKVERKENDLNEEIERLKTSYSKQTEKLKSDSEEELARMKEVYERQLEAVQSAVGQTRDVSGMMDKVDALSTTIARLAGEVTTVNDRTSVDKEHALRTREDQLALREETLERERSRLEEEKKVVYELNTRLRDMSKDQEKRIEEEKWKAREEWNRLTAEKEVFRQDQKYVLERLERQKGEFEATKSSFLREQHDLLVRVSNERVALDAERSDFTSQRNTDLKRLREEATTLQSRSRNIQVADAHVEELKRFYYAKFKQLQELEASLMDECVELERIRTAMPLEGTNSRDLRKRTSSTTRKRSQQAKEIPETRSAGNMRMIEMGGENVDEASEEEQQEGRESVRAVLKKHSQFLSQFSGESDAPLNSHIYRDL